MWERTLFYLVFASQVVLISYYFPRRILGLARHVVDTYPPSGYPKLYAVPAEAVETALSGYRKMNRFALLVGVALLVAGIWGPGDELFRWNSGSVLALYMLVQFVPLVIATSTGFPFFSQKRKPDAGTTRKAELRPRRLFDFVSPALVGAAVAVYAAFVVLIVYVQQFGFPWFGGYWNIVGVTVLNLLFAGAIFRFLYGKAADPYQTYEDRARSIERNVKQLLYSSIVWTTFLALSISLRALGLGDLIPLVLSLYIQLVAVISFRSLRIDETNFEVYREEPAVAQGPS